MTMDQRRLIVRNKMLSDLEIEEIRRSVGQETVSETNTDNITQSTSEFLNNADWEVSSNISLSSVQLELIEEINNDMR